jgi:hypothetical protein
VTDIGLKGKAKTPTVVLASGEGEKLVLKLEVKQQLDEFQLDEEFTVKITNGGQTTLASRK